MPKPILLRTACVMAVLLQASPVLALDKIYSPNVTKGEVEVEYSGSSTFDRDHDKDHAQAHEVELEYGLTDRFALELSGVFEKQPDAKLNMASTGLGGRYSFFEPGEKWLDAGVLVSYGRATHAADADAIEAKLLLEKQSGKFLHRANIGIEQEVGSHATGGPDRVLLWNSRYRYSAAFEPGIELQSDFGKANEHLHFNQQEHFVGPALYGKITSGIKYEAAYLFGVTDAAPQQAARVLIEYEFVF